MIRVWTLGLLVRLMPGRALPLRGHPPSNTTRQFPMFADGALLSGFAATQERTPQSAPSRMTHQHGGRLTCTIQQRSTATSVPDALPR